MLRRGVVLVPQSLTVERTYGRATLRTGGDRLNGYACNDFLTLSIIVGEWGRRIVGSSSLGLASSCAVTASPLLNVGHSEHHRIGHCQGKYLCAGEWVMRE